ncbi:MAG: two-partner secretion domain-containing protein, partial [Burkholderiaceae bacterium]
MDTHASFNKSFRLVWSAARSAWVAVAETARGRGKAGRRRRTGAARAAVLGTGLAAATAFAAPPSTTPPAATQLPTGGQVVAGQAALAQSGATLTVTQSSSRAAIDWQTFDLGAQARIDFRQPDANAVTLNRVLATDGSRIFGRISAPGQVFLLNPNGVLFGATAQVDVGGLVASTLSLSDADFMAGRATFGADGAAGTGAIVNDGTLAAKAGGYVALLAPQVRNEGVIVATEGTVALAAGDQVTLQFGGTRPIAVQVDRAAVDALVANGRAIRADGGLVVMSARSASALLDTVVADTGTVSADTLAEHGGRIVLEGGGRGVVEVAGTLQARGTAAGTTGGTVLVTGDRIHVQDGARLDASGTAGGGSVLVGGGWHGAPAIAQASATVVDPGAILDASATRRGNGGTVEAWSDVADASGVTRAEGTFLAQGGPQGGDGGRIETSGHWLDTATARGGAAAAQGAPGSWLFDPYDVSIVSGGSANASQSGGLWTPTGSSSQIQNTQIQALLEAGTSVTVTTGSSGSELGDISVLAPISKTTGAADVTLTLRAANTIAVEQPIANTGGGGKLAVVLSADDDNGVHDGNGAILLDADITTGGGALAFGSGASMTINNVATLVGGDVFVAGSGRRTISTGGGGFTVNGEMLIANPSGLEIDTAGGNVAFGGLVNSGDGYALVNTPVTWAQAFNLAKSGTGADPGDTYLATITSRLENAVASRTANYAGAWLGGHRGPTDGTTASVDDQWRWVTGPEGLANGGTGTVFYTVASGSTAAGLYSNWAPGEPNNTLPGYPGSPVPTSLNGESALQFSGSAGQWNDLADGIGRVDGNPQAYLVETRLANSPLTINAGTGSVSFANAVGGLKPLASLSVTAAQASVGGAVATSGAQVWATPVSGTGLTLTGSAITLDGAVTATGGATITSTAGNVTLAAGLASDGDVAVTAAGGGLTGAGGIALTGATGVLTVTQDGNTTYSGNVSGADASLVKAGAGILGLSGANAFPQGIALDGGELELDSGGAIGSSGTIGFAGGTLRFTPANDADCSARFSNAPGQAYSFDVQGAAVSFASDLTSAGGTLAVRGTDVVELDGNNTYDGGTTVHGGTLFGGGGSMTRTAFGSGAITVEPGATLWTDRGTLGNALVLAGGKLMGTNGFGEVWSGSVDVTADSTIEAWYYVTLSGAIGGSGKLTKTESGVLTIAGADTRAAGYVVSAGTLQVGAGGTTGSVAGDIVDDASLAFDRSDTVTYAGTISGTGDVHQAGHGKTALAGTLAYTGATSIDAGTLAIHADVPSYATSGFSGAGTLAIEPASASFPSAYTFSLAFPSLGGLVLGKAGNTADITLGAATTVAGPVTIQGGNVSLANNLTVSTASPILVQATGDIVQSSGVTVSTHGGSVTYQSNAAGAGAGYIWLAGQGQATTISTSGGAITLSGGTNVTTGWAVGAASGNGNGVTLDDASLASAGGTVTIRGQGYAGSPVAIATTDGSVTSADGVRLAGGSAIAAGGGRIAVTGDAPGLGTAIGVDLGSSTASVLSSTSAVSGAIVVTGSSDGAGADTSIGVATGLATLQETGNGGIQLLGSGRDDAVLAGSGSSVLARVGAIVLQGTTGGLGTAVDVEGVVGQKAGSAVPASTSSVTLSSDHLAIGGTVQAGGTLTLSPSTAATNVQLATTGSGLVLPASWFGTNVSGFSTLVVGRTDGSGTLTVGALTWGGALTLDDGAGAIQLTGALDIGTHAMTVSGNGSIAETAAGGITATSLRLVGTGSYDLSLGTNGVGTLAARTGSVAYVNGRALTIGTLSGTVGVTSLSSGTLDVETTGGQLTVASAVSTGNTGASAVRLVAGSSVAAGTAAGGDVVISGAPSIATGAGGRATLYTGSLAGSTGVAARVGSGSGRFRYDSSVGTPNFTTSLGTGLYAVYREQPAVTITAGGAAKTYDGQAWSGGNGYGAAGWVNGDTAAALAGTITYAGSAQGALDAGSYAIAPGGLSTGLGYGVTYANGTLVVSPKTVSLSAAKVYDGGTDLAGAVSIVTGVAGETLGYTGATASDAHVATAGKYVSAIMLADGTGLASNYVLPALDAAHAPVTITPRPLTPTAAIGGTLSKTYDGTNAAPGATVSGSVAGAIAGDTLTLDLSGVSLAYNGSHVAGTSAVVATGSAALDIASSAAGSAASDYAFAAPTIADAAASITPRTLTSTASIGGTLAKTYDGTNAAPGATVSGSVAGAIAGDTLTLDTSGVQLAYDGIHVVGTGTVVASGSASFGIGSSAAGSVASDYALTQPTIAAAPASITPRTLSATAAIGGTLAKTYDGTTAATAASITGSVTGAIAGDMLVLDATGVSLAYDGAHVTGAHQIAASGSASFGISSSTAGSVASDYAFAAPTIASVTGSITPRTLTANASIGGALTKTYDGTNAATGATVSGGVAGAIAGDTLTLDLSGVSLAYNGSHVVGTNAIVASGSGTLDIASSTAGSVASDYTFTAPTIASVTASITPRTLIANASIGGTLTKTYDGTNAATGSTVSGGVTGAIAGDTLTLDLSGVSLAYNGSHVVGTNAIVASGNASFGISSSTAGSVASDYAFTAPTIASVTASITPRTLTSSASIGGALTKTYDGTDAATGSTVSGGVTGAIAGDTLTLDLSGVSLAYNGSHVIGTNAIVASGSGTLDIASSTAGSVASDYTFTAPTIASVTASITPRTL